MPSYVVFRSGFVACAALMLALVGFVIGSKPTQRASRLGLRGLQRRRAIQESEGWRSLEPLVRWLGLRVSVLVDTERRAAIDKRLQLGGDWLGLTPDEYVALGFVGFVGGLGFGAVVGYVGGAGMAALLLLAPVGAVVPSLMLDGAIDERMRQMNRGLPYAIDLLALAMSAGLDFPGALRQVVEKSSNPDDAVVQEFSRVQQGLQLGFTRKQALLELAERAPTESVTEFVNALVLAEERGNPVGEVLLVQAGVSRMRRTVRAEESAAKAGVKMVGPLFLLFGCIMILVMGPMILKLMEAD
jgi:tight adherence protein C